MAPDVAAQTPDDDTAVFYIHPVKSDGTVELTGQRVTVSEDDGKLVFRVQHARSPERENGVGHAIKFNYCVVDDRQSKPGWHVRSRCGGNTATLPANTAYVDVEVPVRANTEGPGGNNGARVILTAGTGYITLNTSAFYTIRDGTDTEPARQSHNVLIRSSDKNKEWTEGEKLSFEIRLNRPAQVPFDVHLKVSESGFGDFVAAAHEGHKTVRFKHGQTWYNYLVPTVKNAGSRQPQSVVTVTLTDTNGNALSGGTTVVPGGRGVYRLVPNGASNDNSRASSTVVDVDPLREMSFETASQEVQEDAGIVNLKVNFLPPPTRPIGLSFALEGSATLHQDYFVYASLVDGPRTGWLRVWAWEPSVTIPIKIRDDHISDDRETIVVRLLDSGRHKPAATGNSVTLTIRNHDPGPPARPAGSLPADHPLVTYGFLVSDIRDSYILDHDDDSAHPNWKRVLKALGDADYADYPRTAMTAAQAATLYRANGESRWAVASAALAYAERYFSGTTTPPPASDPEVTIAAGDGVTEGTSATFTLTADPAPTAPLDVSVTVATDGDYGITAGTQTVTIPTTGSATLTLATTGDEADEADGSVTVTVDDGTGYTVGSASSGTVAIADDDAPGSVLPAGHPVMKYASLVKSFHDRIGARHEHGDGPSGGWNKRFLKAMGHPEYVDYPQAAVTVADATRMWNHGGPGANTAWDGTVEAVTYAEQYFAGQTTTPDPAPVPEVTIAAGDGVTEGTSATFTLTADPAPSAALDVTVTVATDGDYGVTAGTRTVTIPTSGSYVLTLTTAGDEADEADGSVSVTVDDGTGYTVGSASSGSVAIADDDDAAPETGTAHPAVDPALIAQIREWMKPPGPNAAARNERFTRVLAAFGAESHANPMTVAEAEGYVRRGWGTRWQPIVDALKAIEAYVAPPSTADTTVDPAPVPEVTIAAGAGVTEGTSVTFTLTADPAPSAALDVTVTVATEGEFGIAAGEQTVTIPTTGSATLTLATAGDDADEPDGSVSVTVDDGTGYTVGDASSGSVAIADDDLPPPQISVAAKATPITEGGNAVFTLKADRAVDADLAVTLTVSEKAGSDFVAAAGEGEKTVTILDGKTEATLTVKTDDDAVDEPDGSVSATVDAGTGYTVASSPANAASVAVADNDAAGRPMVSVDDATAREGQTMQFTVRLSAPSKRYLFVRLISRESTPVSARLERDFAYASKMVKFRPGQTAVQFGVRTLNDSHDDGGETFEAKVQFVFQDMAGIADGVAVGTIENDDPMPAAYLARFGRTVAEQALEGISGRMSADRTPGMQGTVAGQALGFDPAASDQAAAAGAVPGATGTSHTTPVDRQAALAMAEIARGLGADASDPISASVGPGGAADRFGFGFGDNGFGTLSLQSRTMTARDALLGSSFSLTGQRDGAGGSLAFWGRTSQGSFDGAERGDGTDITLDGTVTTGMLGADYARGNWLVGLALTQSSSEGSYAAIGGDDEGDGDVEASLTAAIPYAALQVSERLKLWGAAGYGTGEVTLKTAMGERLSADTSWTMATAGMRSDLLEAPQGDIPGSGSGAGSGPALAVTSDALWARTSSDKTGELAATDSDVTRLRLGLEGSYRIVMEGDSHLTPKLEIGARHDGGDAETGFGVEVGGGIAWIDPSLGLSLDVSGRTLLAHENDDLKDRGFSAALGFDPAPATQRGPSFSLRQDFGGQAQGGLDALFNTAPLEDRTGSEATSRWAMEAAYGLPVFGNRFTGSPHVGFGLSTGSRDYSLGWRLTPEAATAPGLSFGLRATRRESDTADAEHVVGFEAVARW